MVKQNNDDKINKNYEKLNKLEKSLDDLENRTKYALNIYKILKNEQLKFTNELKKSNDLKFNQSIDDVYNESKSIFTNSQIDNLIGQCNVNFNDALKHIVFNTPTNILVKQFNNATQNSTNHKIDIEGGGTGNSYTFEGIDGITTDLSSTNHLTIGNTNSGGSYTLTPDKWRAIGNSSVASAFPIVDGKLTFIQYILTISILYSLVNNTHFTNINGIVGIKDYINLLKRTIFGTEPNAGTEYEIYMREVDGVVKAFVKVPSGGGSDFVLTAAKINAFNDADYSKINDANGLIRGRTISGGNLTAVTQIGRATDLKLRIDFDEQSATDKFIHESNYSTPPSIGVETPIYLKDVTVDGKTVKKPYSKIAPNNESASKYWYGRENYGTLLVTAPTVIPWDNNAFRVPISGVYDSILACISNDSSIPSGSNSFRGIETLIGDINYQIWLELRVKYFIGVNGFPLINFKLENFGYLSNNVSNNEQIYGSASGVLVVDTNTSSGGFLPGEHEIKVFYTMSRASGKQFLIFKLSQNRTSDDFWRRWGYEWRWVVKRTPRAFPS